MDADTHIRHLEFETALLSAVDKLRGGRPRSSVSTSYPNVHVPAVTGTLHNVAPSIHILSGVLRHLRMGYSQLRGMGCFMHCGTPNFLRSNTLL